VIERLILDTIYFQGSEMLKGKQVKKEEFICGTGMEKTEEKVGINMVSDTSFTLS
jgi:hypothetical protein